ncbi:MAG: ABC transporter substrate-binding protein [Chloroflexota bacterium]
MKILQPSVQLADPHICSDAKNRLNIFNAIFDTLIRRAPSGHFVPGLAQTYHLAEDARTWTFQLREDVRFHNGATFNAKDVTASLARACDPSVGGELGTEGVWASYLGDATVTAVDPYTVRMVTGRPMADLLDLLIAIPIMPADSLPDLPETLIGSGPYRLAERSADQIVLTAFGESRIREATAPELVWQAIPDENLRIELLSKGEADLITDLSPGGGRSLAGKNLHLISQASNLCVAFLFNILSGPCTDVRVRQAINHAVDVDRMIAEAADGGATPLNGPLTPLHFGADAELAPFAHDPQKAKALFEEAGLSQSLVIDLPTRLPDEALRLGEMLAEDLAAVGVEVELRHFEDRVAYAHMVKDKQIDDACCFDSSPLSTYRVLREKINSEVAGPWWQGYHNAIVNRLLDQAAEIVDVDTRRTVYEEAYRIMAADAPWLFLYRPTRFWGSRSATLPIQLGRDSLLLIEK